MIERADHMTEPLVKGQFYLVPTVYGKWWASEPRPWPVIGAMHTDPEFFDFREPHYHIDARFVAQKWHDQVVRTPLTRLYSGCVENIPPLSKPIIKRLKCLHPAVPYRVYPDEPHRVPVSIIELRNAYTGHQCQHGKGGWICPHRKASLGSIAPIEGIITCPLHGLRIDAASGKVL